MAVNRPVWGIDLGQCALKAIKLRLAGDKVEAVDHAYVEHHRILSQPDADRPALIAEAMKKFTARHDLSKETLVVGVPGQHTLARFTKLPPVTKKKIPEIVKYEAQQQIPFDMEEVIWDYQVFEDTAATETQVGIFAMRRELLRSHLAFLSSLNYEPAIVQASPLALYNALKYDGIIGGQAVTILDIGAQNTDLIVADGETLWTRNIPIGGNNFTDALLKTFKLSFNKAENLKRTAGSSKYARQVFQAMRPVFADLVAEVQRSIGFFTSSRRGVKLEKLVAMGNAFKLPGMVKFVQQNLGMEVIRPTRFNKLSATEAASAPELLDQLLSFGVAYGLALQGLGLAAITSNLLPPEIAKQVVWRKKTPWFYGAAACLTLSAMIVWGRNIGDNSVVQRSQGVPMAVNFKPIDLKNPQPDAQAVQIVTNGPTADNPLQKAKQLAAAGQHLNEVLDTIHRLNETEVHAVEELSKLDSYKVVWPRILQLIHSALPKPDEELNKAMAQGMGAVRELIQAHPEKYARGQRQIIFIDRFDASFSQDVMSAYQATRRRDSTGATPTALPEGGSGAAAKPGFLITIHGRTPYQGKNPAEGGVFFVNNTFLKKLRTASAPGVYLDAVGTPWQNPVKTWTSPAAAEVGRPPTPGAQPSVGGSPAGAEKDPFTGEPINDTEFEITFVAILGDKPAEVSAG